MVAFSRIRIQGVGWIDPVSLAMLLDVCIYVLCMYGSSLWVYTRPRAGLNSIGLRGVLAFEVFPATSRSNCHSHQVIIFSVSFSSIFKRCPTQILWEVNFLFVNVVRGEQTGLSAEECDLCESLQISSSSFWIGSISKWCNFDDQSFHSKKTFRRQRPIFWELLQN